MTIAPEIVNSEELEWEMLDRPADGAVLQRLQETVIARRLPPGADRAQHVHDPADHTPVVHTGKRKLRLA